MHIYYPLTPHHGCPTRPRDQLKMSSLLTGFVRPWKEVPSQCLNLTLLVSVWTFGIMGAMGGEHRYFCTARFSCSRHQQAWTMVPFQVSSPCPRTMAVSTCPPSTTLPPDWPISRVRQVSNIGTLAGVSDNVSGNIISLAQIGAAIGSVFTFLVLEKLGRLWALRLGCAINLVVGTLS